jgi:hypothetical protein
MAVEKRRRLTSSEMFWRRVDRSVGESACWPWPGAKHKPGGYGRFGRRNRGHEVSAHRFAYADTHGPIPDGLHVLHSCDNPACCNPGHLSLGTHADNMADMAQKKRCPSRQGERSPTAKLTEDAVRTIRSRLAAGERPEALAPEYGVATVTVQFIGQRRLWKHVA